MIAASNASYTADTAAALAWLVDAGVDTLVAATPRHWLADPAPAIAARPVAARPAVVPKPTPAPPPSVDCSSVATLTDLTAAVADFAHSLRRTDLAPQLLVGNAETGIVILCDQTEADGSPAAVLRGRMLAAIGLDTGNAALLHRVPWPMSGGRAPRNDELLAFAPFVSRALSLVQPRAVLALGQLAAAIAGDAMALGSARGRWHDLAVGAGSVPVLASLHPRLLLATPARKREAWADLQAFAARLEAGR